MCSVHWESQSKKANFRAGKTVQRIQNEMDRNYMLIRDFAQESRFVEASESNRITESLLA